MYRLFLIFLFPVLLFSCKMQDKGTDPWQEDFHHQPLSMRPPLEVAYIGFDRDKFCIHAQDYRLIGELTAPHRLIDETSQKSWLWMELTDTQGKRYSTQTSKDASRINLYRRGPYYCEIHWFDMTPVADDNKASALVADLALFCYPEKILAQVTWHAKEDFNGAKLYIKGIAPKEFDLKPFKKGDIQTFAFPLFGEQSPLPDDAFALLKGATPVKYDPVRGCYRVGTNDKGNFQTEFYETPNRYETASIQVTNDDRNRKIYVCHESTIGRCIVAGGVLLNEQDDPLPLLVQISKNFDGEKEEPFYNPTDIPFSETIFPLYLAPNESRVFSSLHLHQQWGRHLTKHWSSLGAWMDYFQSATGVTETTCYVPFKFGGKKGISIADYRAMSQQAYWSGQPQHDNVAGHSFISYNAGEWQFPEYVRTLYRSTGPNWFDIGLEYLTTDGRIRATIDAWESPQTDELRSYFRIRYEVLEPVEISNATTDFRLLSISTFIQGLRYTRFGATGVEAVHLAPANNSRPLSSLGATGVEAVRLDPHNKPFPVKGVALPKDKFHITLFGDTARNCGSNSVVVNRFSAPFAPAATVQQGQYHNTSFDVANVHFKENPNDVTMSLVSAQDKLSLKKGDLIEIEGYWFCYGDNATTTPVERCVSDYCDNAPRIIQVVKGREVENRNTLWIEAEKDKAEFYIAGGRNLIPVVVTGLSDYRNPRIQCFEGGQWRELGHNRNTEKDGIQTFCAEDGSFGAVFLVPTGTNTQLLRVSIGGAPAPFTKIALKTSNDNVVEAGNDVASVRLYLPEPTRTGEQPTRTGEQTARTGEQPTGTGEQPARTGEQPACKWKQSEGGSLFYTQNFTSWIRGGRITPNQDDVDLEYWWQNITLAPAHNRPVFTLEPNSPKLLKGKYMVLKADGWHELDDGDKYAGSVYVDQNAGSFFADQNTGSVNADQNVATVYADQNVGLVYADQNVGSINADQNVDAIYAAGIFAPGSCAVLAYRTTMEVARTGDKLQIALDAPTINAAHRYHQRGKLYLSDLDAESIKNIIINDLY